MQKQITHANVEWRTNEDGQLQPYSIDFKDIYYSTESGQHESEYVFVAHNQLHQRFAQAEHTFTVAETGFGSALNFLVVADCWRRVAPDDTNLNYLGFEHFPLNISDLQIACDIWPQYAWIAKPLLLAYDALKIGKNCIELPHNITLNLYIDDVNVVLPNLTIAPNTNINAWLLDGYSPAKNPTMWQPETLNQIARLSIIGTTFATFTSAGNVRRHLQSIGFIVQKCKGFGKKREMLAGYFVGNIANKIVSK